MNSRYTFGLLAIPEKNCNHCPFLDLAVRSSKCNLFSDWTFKLGTDMRVRLKKKNGCDMRCEPCVEAFPNGAHVRAIPEETP